jgi:GntR family transcriptional regulator/MocR family aminotransferase
LSHYQELQMRQAADIEIAIAPRSDGISLQRWLYEELRDAILTGRLMPGSRLPATRDLALRLKISRGTVLAVYAQLGAEGYIRGATGQGSFVAPELPDLRPRPAAKSTGLLEPSSRLTMGTRCETPAVALSARGKQLVVTPFNVAGRKLPARAFRSNQPDVTAFPYNLWTRIAASRSRRLRRAFLTDGETCGFRPLREAIASYLRSSRGITCGAEQVVVVGSVQQVLDISVRLLLDPGDEVWVEDPGYPGARQIFAAAGAKIVDIPVDAGGMDVAAARYLAPNARLAYVTAGRQAPLGSVLALDRRLALLAWAHRHNAIVIEDDYDSEYRFEGAPLAAMKSLDEGGRVIYCGTFSKLLFPSLRMAYAVLPDQLIVPFSSALSLTLRHVPLIPQTTLHEFIAEGHFGRHVRRMRLRYAERARALRGAADTYLAGLLDIPEITMGLDTPAFLPSGSEDQQIAHLAAQAGIECLPLSFYAGSHPGRPGLVLGFAAVSPAEIESGARTLSRVLEKALYRS